jgi:hypothetical protein
MPPCASRPATRPGAALPSPARAAAGAPAARRSDCHGAATAVGDGTTHLVFTPQELLARFVPLVPWPRINLLLYHGVLAPNAPWRPAVVARDEGEGAPVPAGANPPGMSIGESTAGGRKRQPVRPRYRTWAELMRRAFEADVLACPRCGGRMAVLVTIEDPGVIHCILTHLGLSTEAGEPLGGRAPPEGLTHARAAMRRRAPVCPRHTRSPPTSYSAGAAAALCARGLRDGGSDVG